LAWKKVEKRKKERTIWQGVTKNEFNWTAGTAVDQPTKRKKDFNPYPGRGRKIKKGEKAHCVDSH